MDIADRLQIFLRENGISPSVFADACKIARPTLSQILGKRNKKVSDEVLAKIHEAYPGLSILWLMFGEGQMLGEGVPNANIFKTVNEDSIIEDSSVLEDEFLDINDSQSKLIAFDEEFLSNESSGEQIEKSTKLGGVLSRDSISVGASLMGKSKSERAVVKVMLYYNDGTFEELLVRENK